MIIHGLNPVREAVRAHPDRIRFIGIASEQRGKLQSLMAEAKEAGVGVKVMQGQQIDRIAKGAVHNGVIADVADQSYVDFDDLVEAESTSFILMLDGIQDPQNFGAILRVADGFGVSGVVIPEHDSVSVTATVVKASAGASEWVPIAQVTNLSRAIEKLKELGFWVYGADGSGDALDAIDFTGKVALVLGNEGRGIRRNVLEHCDRTVAIPTTGRLESLNVATATAVLAYEVSRQKKKEK
jgi:23S rRNA (guanosine2251-2'-O)-methyltransferase